ncbi:MAG TPA: TIM barrel protein [Tepidisphaeraceae bacterium]|nr:TIM barrel protein [Tepidisphaeraceae bacterium]
MAKFKFSVMAAALTDDLRNAPRLARSAGFSGIVFDAYSPRLNLAELSGSGKRDFRHLLSAQDQQLAALSVDIGAKGISLGADIDRVIARLDTAMETAIGLGTKLITVDLGPLPAPPPQQPKPQKKINPDEAGLIILPPPSMGAVEGAAPPEPISGPTDPDATGAIDAALYEIGQRADRYGVTNAFRSDLASFAALERAIKSASCPWFGVDLDPVAILRDAWPIDDIFSCLGGLIRHVRGRDAVRGADRRTRPAPIGRGSVNWGEFLAKLDEAGYQGWLTIDSLELQDRAAAAQAALEHLRKL